MCKDLNTLPSVSKFQSPTFLFGNFEARGSLIPNWRSNCNFDSSFSIPNNLKPSNFKAQFVILSAAFSFLHDVEYFDAFVWENQKSNSQNNPSVSEWVSRWWVLRDVNFWCEILIKRLWSSNRVMKERRRWCSSSRSLGVTLRELYLASTKQLSLKRGQVPSRCFKFQQLFNSFVWFLWNLKVTLILLVVGWYMKIV